MALAALGLATLWMAVLADTGASLLVTANSLRLLDGSHEPRASTVEPPVLSHLPFDKRVDRRLISGRELLELHAHADLAIAPGDAASGLDVGTGAGQPERES